MKCKVIPHNTFLLNIKVATSHLNLEKKKEETRSAPRAHYSDSTRISPSVESKRLHGSRSRFLTIIGGEERIVAANLAKPLLGAIRQLSSFGCISLLRALQEKKKRTCTLTAHFVLSQSSSSCSSALLVDN